MVEAAVRKPRVPNDKLHRVTDNRLAEADRKVLHGVCVPVEQAGKIWRITGIKSFKGEGGKIVNLTRASMGSQCIFLLSAHPF